MKDLNNTNEDEFDEIVSDILTQRSHLKIQKYIESLEPHGSPMKLHDIQLELIKFYSDNWNKNEMCINKSRQCGLSVITLAFILNKCISDKNKYLFVIRGYNNTGNVDKMDNLERMCIYNDIEYKRPFRNSIFMNENEVTILQDLPFRLCESRRIVIFYDEYAFSCNQTFIKDDDKYLDYYNNVLRIYASTPNGMNGFFDKWSDSKNRFKINWKDIPGRDEAWKKNAIMTMGSEEKFQQEFENSFINS